MCGIAGIMKIGKKPITEEQVSLFLVGNEHRGQDASGVVIQQANGELDVYKSDEQAWTFTQSKGYLEFMQEKLREDSLVVLVHARYATGLATPRVNNNNHPIYAGKCAIIHNGSIRNDDSLFRELKLDRKCETDSDIIRAIVDENGITPRTIKVLARMTGSAAGAALSPEHPGRLLLFRSGSPMALGSNDYFFVFASERNTIHKAMRPWVKRLGIWFQSQKAEIDYSLMPDNTAWIIDEKGLEVHDEFKTMVGAYVEPIRDVYNNYNARKESVGKTYGTCKQTNNITQIKPTEQSDKEFAWCPSCKREWLIPKGGDASKFYCDKANKTKAGCGGSLVPIPKKARVN